MMGTLRLVILAAALGLPVASAMAASPQACFDPGRKFDARFVGNWEIAQWSVRYSLRQKGRQVCLMGRDASGEWFDIRDLKWNGKVLSASFLMPSTKWRTHSRLTLLDANRVRDDYTSPEGKQTDYWTRRP